MAYIKILPIKSATHVGTAIRYIENPDKAEVLSGFACQPEIAPIEFESSRLQAQRNREARKDKQSIEAYHIIQSFAPGEITPEKAHELGVKLADEFLSGRFEYVISTHIDKNHVHNHIICNAYSYLDGKKLHTQPYKTISELHNINDNLALRNDLSVINNPAKQGFDYREWQERGKGTSWKAQIRQRVNFILARATSYDEFKKYCSELQVFYNDEHKNNQFRLLGMERNVRGDTLGKGSECFTADGIRQKCKDNWTRNHALTEQLRAIIPSCDSFEELCYKLSVQGITVKETYHGLKWSYQGKIFSEYELGKHFSKELLLQSIEQRELLEGRKRDIAQEWTDSERKSYSKNDVPIVLSNNCIDRLGTAGIVLNVADKKIFVSNHLLDSNSNGQVIFHLNPKATYDIWSDSNPDLRESEQVTKETIKGEELLRTLERQSGVKPQTVDVPLDTVERYTLGGITLNLREDGIERIFIPAEFVQRNSDGTIQVHFWNNWNYSFRNEDARWQSVTGAQLIHYVSCKQDTIPDAVVLRRIDAMERRRTRAEAKAHLSEASEALRTLRAENIKSIDDFDSRLDELTQMKRQGKEKLHGVQEHQKSFQVAIKYLKIVHEYKELDNKRKTTLPFRRKAFERKYEQELSAYDNAVRILTQAGIRLSVDPDKLQDAVERDDVRLDDIERAQGELDKRIQRLKAAQQIVMQENASREKDRQETQQQQKQQKRKQTFSL